MDTSYLDKYNDALNKQRLQLESYISTHTGSVPVPTGDIGGEDRKRIF